MILIVRPNFESHFLIRQKELPRDTCIKYVRIFNNTCITFPVSERTDFTKLIFMRLISNKVF